MCVIIFRQLSSDKKKTDDKITYNIDFGINWLRPTWTNTNSYLPLSKLPVGSFPETKPDANHVKKKERTYFFLSLPRPEEIIFVPNSLFSLIAVLIIVCFLSFPDNELYSGTVADFSGLDPIIYREPLQTEQYDSLSLNGNKMSLIYVYD